LLSAERRLVLVEVDRQGGFESRTQIVSEGFRRRITAMGQGLVLLLRKGVSWLLLGVLRLLVLRLLGGLTSLLGGADAAIASLVGFWFGGF